MTKDRILAEYQARLAHWREQDMPIPEMYPMSPDNTLLLKSYGNKTFRHGVGQLLEYLYEHRIVDRKTLITELHTTYPTLQRRLKLLATMRCIRREGSYILATPKMDDLWESWGWELWH